MNIPLNRLYHYIETVAEEIYGDRVLIYRFWPHGSKNIDDLNILHGSDNWYEKNIFPTIYCNDQEPLNYEFYKNHVKNHDDPWSTILKFLNLHYTTKNLNYFTNIFEKNLLLHSEKRSHNLKKYQTDNELISVYYCSHAVIARDWFRYAEHETFQKSTKKTFLIYNRAWSGTREYRLRFSDLLIERNLINQCQISNNPVDPELNIHYTDHNFSNPAWRPKNILENFLLTTTADATSSADFNTIDYETTDIEVVLETLFDDDRLHLTEKSLRPIACGQPFILASTHGSLEYLRSYGFKTFGHIWDEQYDLIEDPEERLITITDLMQSIANWTPDKYASCMIQAQAIADYNRQWFFSQHFFDLVINELKTNLKLSFNEFEQCNNYQRWIDRWQKLTIYPEINNFLNHSQDLNSPTKEFVEFVMEFAQNKLSEITNKNKF
jgi:uncharacterized protein YeaO (DUF488 family)